MTTLRKNQGSILVMTLTPAHSDFPFLERSGGADEFDIIDVDGSLESGTGRDFYLFAKAGEGGAELYISFDPKDEINPFADTESFFRFPILSDAGQVYEFRNIKLSKVFINFNGELNEGASNIEEMVLRIN